MTKMFQKKRKERKAEGFITTRITFQEKLIKEFFEGKSEDANLQHKNIKFVKLTGNGKYVASVKSVTW